jgi:hypothetical protein
MSQIKIGGISGDMTAPGRRCLVVLMPDNYVLNATLSMNGMQMPMSIGGIVAKPNRSVGIYAEIFLKNDATADELTEVESGSMDKVGTKRIKIPLADNTFLGIKADGIDMKIGGLYAQEPYIDEDGTEIKYTVMVEMIATLMDDAEPGAV